MGKGENRFSKREKLHDKREDVNREWKVTKDRIMKNAHSEVKKVRLILTALFRYQLKNCCLFACYAEVCIKTQANVSNEQTTFSRYL